MKYSIWKIKALVFILLFALFAGGRFYNLFIIKEAPFNEAILTGIFYGLFLGMIGLFLVDLVLARGLLQNKIFSLKIIFLLLLFVIVFEYIMINYFKVGFFIVYTMNMNIALITFTLLLHNDLNKKEISIHSPSNELPDIYYKKRPLKTFFELIFRLFPNPEPVGLYKIGNPDESSPVLVTGNFELTIRRVVRALRKMDCWLLVTDSRGLNIWCSSESGHYRSESIIDGISMTNLSEKVSHRNIILPQLSASNIDINKIREETGFSPVFGPIDIKYIDAYFKDPDDRIIRRASFDLAERIEMSFGTPIILTFLLINIFNFVGLEYLLGILPIIYIINFLHSIIFPRRIIRKVVLWSIFFGILVFSVNYLIFSYLLNMDFLISNIGISVGMVYLIIEFEGWSPLVKFSYGFSRKAEIYVDENLCIGCKTCVYVCPKGVFEIKDGKSKVMDIDACESCKACFVQCPAGAIIHSMNV